MKKSLKSNIEDIIKYLEYRLEDVKKDFSSIQSEENKKTWGSGYLRGRIDSFEHAKEVLDSIMKSFRGE